MTIMPHKYCPFTLHPPVFFSDNVGVKHLHSDHSPVVQFTHLIKNNNNNNNKNNKHTPAYSSGLGWAPRLHILIFAHITFRLLYHHLYQQMHHRVLPKLQQFPDRVPAQKFSAHCSSDPKTQCPR